jgi:hypothetical protein
MRSVAGIGTDSATSAWLTAWQTPLTRDDGESVTETIASGSHVP